MGNRTEARWVDLVTSRAAFALVGVAIALAGAPPTHALYGGSEVTPDDAGSIARLTWRRGTWWGTCTGVVVGPDAVLTAGHCARSAQLGELRIQRVDVGHPSAQPERGAVRAVVVHPDFDARRPELGRDLAIVRLRRGLVRARPMPLAELSANVMLAGPNVRIVGFGTTRGGGRGTARLRAATLESLSPFHCFSGDVPGMARTRFCAASPTAGVCPGDSGAPVVLEIDGAPHVVGIVSLAIDNQSRCVESATVATRVSAFREWIEATAGGAAESRE